MESRYSATAAACKLWPCGETALEMSPLNLLLPWNVQVIFLTRYCIHQWVGVQVSACVCIYIQSNAVCEHVHIFPRLHGKMNELFWVASDPAANPPKNSSWAAGDGQLQGWICQEIGPEHTALCVRDVQKVLQNVTIVTQRLWQALISNVQFVFTIAIKSF